jgi:hypothetical protein
MKMDIRAVLLQMRITHTIQTTNLIDQVNAMFKLEEDANNELALNTKASGIMFNGLSDFLPTVRNP